MLCPGDGEKVLVADHMHTDQILTTAVKRKRSATGASSFDGATHSPEGLKRALGPKALRPVLVSLRTTGCQFIVCGEAFIHQIFPVSTELESRSILRLSGSSHGV